MKRISVIGSGYVGLVTGAMLASVGNRVICVDKDPAIIEALSKGTSTIHEPGLEEVLRTALAEGTLRFTTGVAEAVEESEATFLAVGTPSLESGAYDFQYVEAAAREVGSALRGKRRHLVILKSTVTPDIYDRVQQILAEQTRGSGVSVELASNPEFLAEGTAVRDFAQPNRVIVGTTSPEARDFLEALYAPFTKRKPGVFQATDPKSAVITKLAANTFLACRVALVNELAQYCDAAGADIEHVRIGLASDPRIGQLFLFPGPGYGGSCFGKDLRALRESAREHGTEVSLIPAIEESNKRHKLYVVRRMEQYLGDLRGKTVAIWGIAFKARTDDIRESPAVTVIEALLERGARVQAHDPAAHQRAEAHFGGAIQLCTNKYEALHNAAALVILTEWDTYKSPDYAELAEQLSSKIVFDARNILDRNEARRVGLRHIGMGRNGVQSETAQA